MKFTLARDRHLRYHFAQSMSVDQSKTRSRHASVRVAIKTETFNNLHGLMDQKQRVR